MRALLLTMLAFIVAVTTGVTLRGERSAVATVAGLAFLAGTWRGTTSTGLAAEEVISEPRGGVILAAGREFRSGRCVFFDLVVIAERDDAVVLLPHPNGKRSPHAFPLVAFDVAGRRAEFANPTNDFPQTFVYQLDGDGRLRITLSGGDHREEYLLERVAPD